MKKIFLITLSVLITVFVFGQRTTNFLRTRKNEANIVKGTPLKGPKSDLFESFEGEFPPAGWTQINPLGGDGWKQVGNGENVSGWDNLQAQLSENGGSKAVFATWNSSGASSFTEGTPTEEWLITPQCHINDGDFLKFQIQHLSNYLNNLDVLICTSTYTGTANFDVELDNLTFPENTEWEEKSYDLSAYVGQDIYIAFKEHVSNINSEGGVVMIDLVQIGEMPAIALSLKSLDIPKYVKKDTDFNIKGTVVNNGADNITSFDVTYNIDGGSESAVFKATGLDVALGKEYEFTHDVPCNLDTDGTYTINVTISNVNGGGEVDIEDNVLTSEIIVFNNSVQRTVLLEQFTTENCSACPPVLEYIEGVVSENENLIMMTHHAGFYTDFLTIPESEAHVEFYNSNGSYCPAGMYDRHYNGLNNDDNSEGPNPGPVFLNAAPFGGNRFEDRISVPAFVTVRILGENNDGTLTIKVKGGFFADFVHDMGISLWITEDHIKSKNQAGNSDLVHRYSVRDAISERLGDPITTTTNNGDSYEVEYTYTLNKDWNANELYLVAMVNNMNAADVNDREILNAAQVKLTDLSLFGVNKIKTSVDVYPNPAREYVSITNVENSNIEIYNVLGELVYSKTSDQKTAHVNTSNFESGNYIIKVIFNNLTTTKKLNIVR